MATVTYIKAATGTFDVIVDGVANGWLIVNGNLGKTGRDANMYGIARPDRAPIWVGSLAETKRFCTARINTKV